MPHTEDQTSLLATLLAPLFRLSPATAPDPAQDPARIAAAHAIAAYAPQSFPDLLIVAQIIALSLATISGFAQAAADLPLSFALRLRGNANACQRSAARHTHARTTAACPPLAAPEDPPDPAFDHATLTAQLEANRRRLAAVTRHRLDAQASPTHPTAAQSAPAQSAPTQSAPTQSAPTQSAPTQSVLVQPAPTQAHPTPAAPTPAAPPENPQHLWAAAMTSVASEYLAEMENLPPEQRRHAAIQAAALNGCAADLFSANLPPFPA